MALREDKRRKGTVSIIMMLKERGAPGLQLRNGNAAEGETDDLSPAPEYLSGVEEQNDPSPSRSRRQRRNRGGDGPAY